MLMTKELKEFAGKIEEVFKSCHNLTAIKLMKENSAWGSENDLANLWASVKDNPYDFGDKKSQLSKILSITLRAAAVESGLLEVEKVKGGYGTEDAYFLKNPLLRPAFMEVLLVKGEVLKTIEKLLEPIEDNSYTGCLEKLKQFKM
jgi:hypothetical protein